MLRHKCVYEMLKRAGHSAAKAIEIVLDARRGDEHALVWIGILRKASRHG